MDPSSTGSEPPKKSVPQLAKLGWRAMLIFNLGLGAYIFAKKREKDIDTVDKKGGKKGLFDKKGGKKGIGANKEATENKAAETSDDEKVKEPVSTTMVEKDEETKVPIVEQDPLLEFSDATTDAEQSDFASVVRERVRVAKKPIAEDEQREVLKWILEEKRKMKGKDREEKRRIDEEKGLLKKFIRAEKIPKFLNDDDSVDSSLRDWDKFFSSK